MSRRLALAAALAVLLPAAADADPPEITPLHGRLGGITEMRRWTSPRPDGGEIDYQFLVRNGRGLPEAVQVLDDKGQPQTLADEEGSDCTQAAVALVKTKRGDAVVWALRPFIRPDLSKAEPAPMDIFVFRPHASDLPGDSAVVLRASGPPRRTLPLCLRARILRAMTASAERP